MSDNSKQLMNDDSVDCEILRDKCLKLAAEYRKSRMYPEAEAAARKYLEACDTVWERVKGLKLIGDINADANQFANAKDEYKEAIALIESISDGELTTEQRIIKLQVFDAIHSACYGLRRNSEAHNYIMEGEKQTDHLAVPTSTGVAFSELWDALSNHMYLLLDFRLYTAARGLYGKMLEMANKHSEGHKHVSGFCRNVLSELQTSAHPDTAAAFARDTLGLIRREYFSGWRIHKTAHMLLGEVLMKKGKYAEATYELFCAYDAIADYTCRISPETEKDRMRILKRLSETLTHTNQPEYAALCKQSAKEIYDRIDD